MIVPLAIAAALVAAAPAAAPKPRTVTIADNYYAPAKLTVRKDTKVIWRWPDEAGDVHDVKLKKGPKGVKKFHSEPGAAGITFKRKLDEGGHLQDRLHAPRGDDDDDHGPSGLSSTFRLVARLTTCPSCGSEYLQPMRCEAKESDEVIVDLRCSDCMTVLQVPYSRADMEELDRCQSEWRDEIVAAYERSVAESMEALAADPRAGARARPGRRRRLRSPRRRPGGSSARPRR